MAKQDEYIGKTLGEYKIKKLIGKGGMSKVYQGEDQNLGRDVAVKIITLDPDRAKELMKRFEREGRTMGKLDRHPNIVRVYRYHNAEDPRYLVMEYIEGETLTQILARYRNQGKFMAFEELIKIMRQVADALDFAHAHDVIHRDIKPSNIMIEVNSKRAVLMDFGLVMQANTDTTLGTAFGTPRYISPEQAISSQQAVPQSDIYSLGVIIYEAITGKAPFDDESAMSLALSHITNPPPNPQDVRADLSDDISKALLKALEKTPEERYQSATDMVDALATAMGIEAGVVSTPKVTPPPKPAVEAKVPAKNNGVAKEIASSKPAPSKKIEKNNRKDKKTGKMTNEKGTQNGNRRWLYIVGAVVLIAVMIGIVALASDGGDNGGDNGNQSEVNFNRSDDIQLRWTNDFLMIYNQSGETLDITGLIFMAEDETERFITRDVGAEGRLDFLAQQCIFVSLRNVEVQPPQICANSPYDIKDLSYFEQSNEGNYLNWVWINDGSADTFDVVLVPEGVSEQDGTGTTLATCPIEARRCSFNLPEQEG
ncbi:MAG: serine/threonine protein kinase [Chloroflexi bacterium]|nr:serine/threonine protein kinase [Chloroflexota bacterium]